MNYNRPSIFIMLHLLLLADVVQGAAEAPDGKHIAFSYIGNPENIYVADSDGRNVIGVVVRDQRDFRPEWAPDGTHLVFTSVVDGQHAIMRVDPDGSNLQQLSVVEDAAGDPDYSQDGKRLAYFSDEPKPRELFVQDVATGQITHLTSTAKFDEMSPRWAPDNRNIVFVGKSREEHAESDIWRLDTATGERTNLTMTPAIGEFHPDYSHDGKYVVYIRVEEGEFAVAIRNAWTSEEKIVAGGDGYAVLDPHFSHDDSAVIFTRTDFAELAANTPAIVRVDLHTLVETKLVQGEFPKKRPR